MPKLSQAQIAAYAQSAGLSPDRAKIAAAIALAESGGRTDAHNANPPDDSYGLWQINMIGSMGPSRRAKFGISSNEGMYDPGVNARAMAAISNNGANFSPWATYTSGAYKQFNGGTADAAGFDWTDPFGLNPLAGGGVTGTLSGLTSMAELAVSAGEWLANPHNWVRILQTMTGGLMVGVGLAIITRGTWQPAVNVAKKVASVTPAGRVAASAGALKTTRAVRTVDRGTKAAPKAAPKPKAAAA